MRGAIQAAFDGHLASFLVGNIAWENIGFKPVIGTAWLQPTLMPASSRVVSTGPTALVRHVGYYQITVFTPAAADTTPGAGDANILCDGLMDHFRPGTVLTAGGLSVEVTYAETSPAMTEPPWFSIPVFIGYRAHSYQP
ncbi:MAG TPA: phage tail terminator-like protein [Pseudonocardia sp.]|uniref:phage tail terminator-like protein n=1 Tax=Pseudonocardia sp. TaxID=60912 RepID=UPI002BFB3A67|nr:phage tail terminator-like protein [Pseudonocardia sp.]HTF53704.1 phage tail terminator-like protein [Pseudonocardia sp.]